MPIELRSWINPQSYHNSYSRAPIARKAAYFTPVPEPVTADPDYISAEAREYEAAGYDSSIIPPRLGLADRRPSHPGQRGRLRPAARDAATSAGRARTAA
jgi:hypothetical protein